MDLAASPTSRLCSSLSAALVALSLLAGCARSASEAPPPPLSGPASPGLVAVRPGARPPEPGAPVASGRSLAVAIDVSLAVDDVDRARARVRAEVERAGGYVADAASSGAGASRSAHLDVRVPSKGVRDVREALAAIGDVISDVEKVQDVTEGRADLKARLRNARVQGPRTTTGGS